MQEIIQEITLLKVITYGLQYLSVGLEAGGGGGFFGVFTRHLYSAKIHG